MRHPVPLSSLSKRSQNCPFHHSFPTTSLATPSQNQSLIQLRSETNPVSPTVEILHSCHPTVSIPVYSFMFHSPVFRTNYFQGMHFYNITALVGESIGPNAISMLPLILTQSHRSPMDIVEYECDQDINPLEYAMLYLDLLQLIHILGMEHTNPGPDEWRRALASALVKSLVLRNILEPIVLFLQSGIDELTVADRDHLAIATSLFETLDHFAYKYSCPQILGYLWASCSEHETILSRFPSLTSLMIKLLSIDRELNLQDRPMTPRSNISRLFALDKTWLVDLEASLVRRFEIFPDKEDVEMQSVSAVEPVPALESAPISESTPIPEIVPASAALYPHTHHQENTGPNAFSGTMEADNSHVLADLPVDYCANKTMEVVNVLCELPTNRGSHDSSIENSSIDAASDAILHANMKSCF
ncbi:hypothetical protein CANCADRAFT_30754 [Tortispora caseinolytica NRRL Y-17796]|uniref:Uncharacterized protein n=1 Tax=Tortispora caseinolytica NRRL Y-17796 TaxID=767744 RepID=A0A1E4TLM0_9ASCO|nr:hypothetical protein CANCADRAFT_30754 [Tortispora caseinolytica NRRL Y-17796]